MHKLAEKIAECLKVKVEAMGIDNIEGENLKELGEWVDIIKDIACYDKDMRIIKAMDEAEDSEESMKYIEEYEDYPERMYYRGQPRSQSGRFMSRGDGRRSNRGRGSRRSYEEMYPMTYPMTPEMYHMPMEDWNWDRDMDREGMGRMYYSGGSDSSGGSGSSMSGSQGASSSGMSGSSGGSSVGGSSRGYSEGYSDGYSEGRSQGQRNQKSSRSENARRGYEESKMMQDGSPESKKKAMESLEHYMKELGEDMSELIGKMDASEKSMLKNKLQVLAQKVQ